MLWLPLLLSSQTRLAPGECSLPDDDLVQAYGVQCYDPDKFSLSSDFGNASAMAAYGVESAFQSTKVDGDVGAPEAFEWIISTNLTLEEAQAQVCLSIS